MIGAVEFVRRGTMWAVAPQRPQYRARDEQQSQCGATRKDFSGKPRDPWAFRTQTQSLRAVVGWWADPETGPGFSFDPLLVTIASRRF